MGGPLTNIQASAFLQTIQITTNIMDGVIVMTLHVSPVSTIFAKHSQIVAVAGTIWQFC
jgi:hypothetical protein